MWKKILGLCTISFLAGGSITLTIILLMCANGCTATMSLAKAVAEDPNVQSAAKAVVSTAVGTAILTNPELAVISTAVAGLGTAITALYKVTRKPK
jgi:hypothetical protein